MPLPTPGPSSPAPLPADRLFRAADLAALDFATTVDLAPLPGLVAQPRADAAIRFGTEIAQRGFNIFVSPPRSRLRALDARCRAGAQRGGAGAAARRCLARVVRGGQSVAGSGRLAAWPFARELRLPTHEWHRIDPPTLAAELRAAAADRLLAGVAGTLDIPSQLEMIRGDPLTAGATFCCRDDILVLVPPRLAAGLRPAWQGPGPGTAALCTAGPVLILPDRRRRQEGPVIAVLAEAADPGLEVVAQIALAAGEELRILLADPAPAAPQRASEAAVARGLASSRVRAQRLAPDTVRDEAAGALAEALSGTPESLIVLGHGMIQDMEIATRLARRQGVPVLVPDGTSEPTASAG